MDSSDSNTINLKGLDIAVETAFNVANKYSLVFDKNGNASVFFSYKAHMIEVNKLSIAIAMGKMSKEEAIEQLRKGLVYAMRTGDRYVLYCGNIAPDFKELFNDPVNFPTDKIFDMKEWRKEENYKKIVRPDEDHDLMQNKNCYIMH